ncbi:MAG: glycosyltransferase [Chloroflexota bacterium]
MVTLQKYENIVDDSVIYRLYKMGKNMYSKHIVNVNSTSQGGGVAEMLYTYIPLLNDIGVECGWRILHGNFEFFNVTKKFHNGLQGEQVELSHEEKKLYVQTNENFSQISHFKHDLVEIHDPQPLPLINYYRKRQPWLWRCHIDLSKPDPMLWDWIKRFILKYDVVIVSHENYRKEDLPVEQRIIHPAIDPLTIKNREVTQEEIDKIIAEFNIPMDKPIITQVSRFDKWKDPLGVIEAYKLVREKTDCRLILCGSMASDDPEGIQIYNQVVASSQELIDSGDLMLIVKEDNLLVNVLQRISSVIIQKSLREGFGLTVTEALWKGTPVVASNIGGIPLQIKEGVNGYLCEPNDIGGVAERIIYLLEHESHAKELGAAGRDYVRRNFLMTRLLLDYMRLFEELL